MRIFKLINGQDFAKHRSSASTLIAANVLPLLGVLFWGWSTFAVVAVYWVENVVLGLINVLKMLSCKNPGAIDNVQGNDPSNDLAKGPVKLPTGAILPAKLFFSGFFTIHYGIFCLVHGVFVMLLLGDGIGRMGDPFDQFPRTFAMLRETGAIWGIVALTLSHLYSFVSNYLIGGECERTSLASLMIKPYARIVILHVAILFGAFATVALGSPVWILVILIAGKTTLDLVMHLREHGEGFSPSQLLHARLKNQSN